MPRRPADTPASTPPIDDQYATYPAAHSADGHVRRPETDDGHYQNHGHYSLLRAVARGGMGRVSIARDDALKRDVALKELLDGAADSPDSQRRFVAEAEITGQLEHPGVVPIYALGADKHGNPFYTMRFVKGQTLQDAIDAYHRSSDCGAGVPPAAKEAGGTPASQRSKEAGGTPAPQAAELKSLLRRFVMVCQTVAYAHNRGVIHRDLKPANIMLGRFGETLVMDWGLAKPVDDGKSAGSTIGVLAHQQLAGRPDLTGSDAVVGTPAYMPPEQASRKVAELGPAADVYSLGAVLYHLLTGAPPYSGSSSGEVLEKVRSSSPARPSAVCRGVPRALEAICLKAMARRPKARYPSAAELAESVERWLDDEPVEAYREPLAERLYRWSRKHKTGVVSGIISLLMVTLIGSAAIVIIQRERDKARVFERIAADYAQDAADADQRAKDKEAEAERLAQEASDSRGQARDATQKGAEARQAAEEAKKQVAELEAALAAKTGESEELTKNLESARANLAAAEARAESESKRADAAVERASELERQVAALRREADDYREITLKLTRLADLAANQRQGPAVEANHPWDDFTQRDPASFDVVAADNTEGTAVADAEHLRTGRQSLRVTADSGGVCVTYPKSRNANWDLSKYDHLTFAFSLGDADVRYRDGLAVRIGRGSQSIEYRAKPEALSLTPKGWAFVKIPLWGNSIWTKREVNPLNLSRVDWIQVSISTWTPKLTFWLDDIKFGADPRHIDRELVPDPDRAAAEYVVATKGEADAWVSGKTVKI
ncbi:MAG: serine/threonine-protein kinase, partial [Pirellulales bacterium]